MAIIFLPVPLFHQPSLNYKSSVEALAVNQIVERISTVSRRLGIEGKGKWQGASLSFVARILISRNDRRRPKIQVIRTVSSSV